MLTTAPLHIPLRLPGQVPALVERARAALADGYAIVIGLQSTGEAALEKALAADADLRAPISLCRAIVLGFLEAHFPVTKAADAKLDKELNRAEETVRAHNHRNLLSRMASLIASLIAPPSSGACLQTSACK